MSTNKTQQMGTFIVGRCSTIMMEEFLSENIGEADRPSPSSVTQYSRDLPFSPRARDAACAGVHLFALSRFYADGVPIPPVVTVGNVSVDGEPRYVVTRQGLRHLLRTGPEAKDIINVHMWLTFADFTILDLTLLSGLELESGEEPTTEREDGLAILGQPQELKPRLTYSPMLVGEEFAWRIGATHPEFKAQFKLTQNVWKQRMLGHGLM